MPKDIAKRALKPIATKIVCLVDFEYVRPKPPVRELGVEERAAEANRARANNVCWHAAPIGDEHNGAHPGHLQNAGLLGEKRKTHPHPKREHRNVWAPWRAGVGVTRKAWREGNGDGDHGQKQRVGAY